MLQRERVLQREKANAKWLQERDANTRFFYLSPIIHHRKNLIDALLDQNNLWVIERGKIGDAFIKYYSGLFNSSGPNFPTDLEALGQPSISEAQNDILCIVPSEKEIQAVVFNMENGKNPSQDGMTVSFYKSYWL